MYSSLSNQLYHFGHYLFSFLLLMGIWPAIIFAKSRNSLEQAFSNFIRIVFLYILIGYSLVLLKVFEVVTILIVLLILALRDSLLWNLRKAKRNFFWLTAAKFYDLMDSGFHLKQVWLRLKNRLPAVGKHAGIRRKQSMLPVLLLLIVAGASAYVRFQDAFSHAAPALSDGYVTLAWMKYINQRILFHDGIYPQGFHIILAYLYKFAAIDQLYIIKYSGPAFAIVTVVGLYFGVSRLTGNQYAGILAAALYGIGGEAFHGADWIWMRQAATNSQEFALAFVVPTLYFLIRYVQHGDKQDLLTSAAGVSVTGLVHSLVFAYVGLLLGLVILIALMMERKRVFRKISWLSAVGGGSLLVAVLPLVVGLLLGKTVNSSSEEFLLSTVDAASPDLRFWDYAGLLAVSVRLLSLANVKQAREERMVSGVIAGLGLATFLLYSYGGVLTQSSVIATRVPVLWALAASVSIGAAWGTVWEWMKALPYQRVLQGALSAGLLALLLTAQQIAPIMPYKMQWNSSVEQYLRIASANRPQTWLIVGQSEEYALVLGNGYTFPLRTLLDEYDPSLQPLTKRGEGSPDPNLPPDLYIFQEKQVYRVNKDNAIYPLLEREYERRERDNRDLNDWVRQYETANGRISIYFEDENLRVYHIQMEKDAETRKKRIWGTTAEIAFEVNYGSRIHH